MDMISQLPDDVLLKILSLLHARDVVATMVLSKQWQFLWTLVPKLVYDYSYHNIGHGRFTRFVDRSLVLHKAPVIETLKFIELDPPWGAGKDNGTWIQTAVKRCVRKLTIECDTCPFNEPVTLPRCLYTCCTMLVTLKLSNAFLDDVTSQISFPSLKKLRLQSMTYPGNEFVTRLLAGCPLLEELYVEQCPRDNVRIFTVKVPSLKRLSYYKSTYDYKESDGEDAGEDAGGEDDGGEDGFVIDAPCLEYLNIRFDVDMFCIVVNEMRDIEEVVVVSFDSHQSTEILRSVTRVKSLYVCLSSSEDAYLGSVFPFLVHLKMCTCEPEWLNLLMRLLKDSPKLQSISLEQTHDLRDDEPRPLWIEPSSVPECLLSSLETFKWVSYEGKEEEKQVVAYILRNARRLEKVYISTKSTDPVKKLEMLKVLSSFVRASPTCQLTFD